MNSEAVTLKVLVFNAENLFLLCDRKLTLDDLLLDEVHWQRLSTSIYENKPLGKLREIEKIITETNPDLIALCEVGGIESLTNFNHLFLKDQYSPLLLEGNSDRHIDVGFLLRKNLPFYFDLISNKNRILDLQLQTETPPEHGYKFSRDALELHLFKKRRDHPFLVVILTHLKSRLDPENLDPNGFLRRTAEVKELVRLIQEIQNKHGLHLPLAVVGDFNGLAQKTKTDLEFQELYAQTDLEDVCESAGVEEKERATYFQISRNNRTEGRQIDYAFLSKSARVFLDLTSVRVYRYKDQYGMRADPPMTLDSKQRLPSDHYPILFSLVGLPLVD
jgi:endonuclease/exonuclease/phosphatase family metal-dependent hydrolase